MANDPSEQDYLEEEEGGPVKSFLDHLEDLRWMLIKSVSAIGIAVVLCLIAGDKLVTIVKWPLTRAKVSYPHQMQVVTAFFGTNRLGVFQLGTNEQRSLSLGTNQFVAVRLEPIQSGTNLLLGLRVDSESKEARSAERLNIDLINLSPAGGFLVAFQIAIYGGIVVASPLVFYFVAQFVFPALKRKERKYVHRGIYFGIGLFLVGVAFCYFILMPLALAASQMYSRWLGFSAYQWKADEYISFVCKFMLGMGLGFEMPVVILILVKIGILSHSTLKKMRPYMVVINLILGAILTTPEVITQVMMFIPLQVLYEISVWIAWYWERQDKKRMESEQFPTD
jgi:sec-independent protein translocase protein TatC